jgi:dihydroflavonol-4-reductase
MYLLTGAAGFLGNNISRILADRGSRVRALVLEGDPAAKKIPVGVEKITGDLLDRDALERFFEVPSGIDLVVLHIASFVMVVPNWNQSVYDVNITGTRNIVDKCLEHKVKKLVYVSSTGAIPELARGQIKEPYFLNPDLVIGCYAKTKAMATQLVLDAAHEKNLDASIVYPSGICGPNDYAYGFVAQFVINYVQGKMPAGIAGSFNSVDVRDLAEGVIACYSGKVYRVHFRDHSPLQEENDYVHYLFGLHLARNNDFDCSKATMELGYQCRPFEETIRDTVHWLETEGKINIQEKPTAGNFVPVSVGK